MAVPFVVNFEEGAEFFIVEGDGRNDAVYEVVDRLEAIPDVQAVTRFKQAFSHGEPHVAQTDKTNG